MENQETENKDINQEQPAAETPETPKAEQNTANESEDKAKLEQQLAEAKDKYMRLFADFENFRRRSAKDKLEFLKTANEGLIVSLLPVLDDFERAKRTFENPNTDIEAIKQGFELIFSKFTKVLENKGLKSLTSDGELFNADLHEAITKIPAPSEDLKGKVVDTIEKGYSLEDKVIRFAKVVIGN
ncbi:MAG: nucleotide exchange factor GrpE [Bacteroidetes bacterium]|nr:MAG: nucleotide exchange factor GrpE [Bacteroidota bacterium]